MSKGKIFDLRFDYYWLGGYHVNVRVIAENFSSGTPYRVEIDREFAPLDTYYVVRFGVKAPEGDHLIFHVETLDEAMDIILGYIGVGAADVVLNTPDVTPDDGWQLATLNKDRAY